jgi:hypothetical protein
MTAGPVVILEVAAQYVVVSLGPEYFASLHTTQQSIMQYINI